MDKLKPFKKELRDFIKKEFKNEKYFCIIYGSCAWNLDKKLSDVDLVLICENNTKRRKKLLVKKVIELHKKFNLEIDSEVPHELKTISNFKDLEMAFKGKGFIFKRKRIIIPPVVKTKSFLRSKKVVLRLLLNAMTSKNIFVCGNRNIFLKEKEKAFKSLIRIVLLAFPIEKITAKRINYVIFREGKLTGELFLGYKKHPVIKNYLRNKIKKALRELEKEKKIIKEGSHFILKNRRWLYEITR